MTEFKTLEAWLVAYDMTDQEFAERSGVTRGYISRLRRNMVHPSLGTALDVVKATGGQIPIDSLLPRTLQPVDYPPPVRRRPVPAA